MIGKSLAHYEVKDKIGEGGMGEVYLAHDTKLGRDVALKMLPRDLTSDPVRRERFTKEAKALASLNHPNIVTIYAIEEHGGAHFICMELIRGSSLGELIPEEGMPRDRFYEIAIPLTDALSAAHDLGVVHRDLKPSNLMINQEGRLKILDFGLATIVQDDDKPTDDSNRDMATRIQLTQEGMMVGTVPYMSPEQIEGKPVDARSDLFSLGIILYEMATGRRPFHGDSSPALMSSILKDLPPPVTHFNPRAIPEEGSVIARCLDKEPRRRFQTAREVKAALEITHQVDATRSGIAPIPTSGILPTSSIQPVPASPGRLENDIFISYAQLDNEAQLSGQQGWVSAFHRSLEVRVGQLLGKKPTIWRDPKTHGDDSSDQIERISSSAILITVLSPRYVKSEFCTREVNEFVRTASASGGPQWGTKYRMFKVVKTPTPVDRHPPEIQRLLSYEFFKMDPETGRPRELDQIFGPEAQRDYWARLDDLAHDIVELLENREEHEDSGTPLASAIQETPSEKGVIYLAPPSYDLKEEYDALRRDLQRTGYRILPDQPLPLVKDELIPFVEQQMAPAKMSIILVGRNYGIVPEGSEEAVTELQNQVAEERSRQGNFHQIVWLPVDLQPADERQRAFVERIQTNPRLVAGSDLLETPFEDLKTVIYQTLEPPARKAEPRIEVSPEQQEQENGTPHIYLICDQRDQDATTPVANFLFDRGFEVTLPIFEGDEAEVREDHEDNLRLCDGVLLYYGVANELWLRRKLREVQKSAGLGRSKSMRAKGILVAPPTSPQKSRLRTREAVVMAGPEQFEPGSLQPFIEALTGSG